MEEIKTHYGVANMSALQFSKFQRVSKLAINYGIFQKHSKFNDCTDRDLQSSV